MFEQITIRNNRTPNRNDSFERSAMQCSGVELTIRNDAHTPELRKRIKCGFDNWGNPIFCNGQILMRPNVPGAPLAFDTYRFPFDLQPGCNPQLTQQILGGVGESIINGLPAFQNKFSFLHLAYTENPWSERLCLFDSNTFSQNDIDWGNYLGAEWDISGGWSATTAPDNGAWARVPLADRIPTDTAALPLPVYRIDRIFSYMLEIFLLRDGSYAVLPVANYQNRFYKTPLRSYIPPRPPYTLLNAHLLTIYPDATVIITDDVMLALANKPSADMIYLANPGGDAWIEQLDVKDLIGRKVIFLIMKSWDTKETQKAYRTAVKMAEKLHSTGITPHFTVLRPDGWRQLNYSEGNSLYLPGQFFPVSLAECSCIIIDMRTFIKSAVELDIPIPPPISRGRYGAIDITDIAESVPLIENIINSGLFTVIIENGKIEQNIISTLIVNKLHNHNNHIPGHWRNLSNRKISCNVFIDAERQRQYLKLLNMLTLDYSSTRTSDGCFLFNTDFLAESAEDGLSTFKGALREHPAKVVLFDAESVWDGGSRSIALFKSALRHCRVNDVAVILILRDSKILRCLPTPDRLIHIWKKGENRFHYIVETESDHGDAEVEPFELKFKNQKWESETVSPDVLSQIPERGNRQNKPGIDASMDLSFDELSAEDML